MFNTNYNPDVLSCLANLSSDEVFTPPALVNQILDLLPQDLWSNKSATFLDPVCKTGVFLREIAKRLDVGLEKQIPNKQKRINHIFKNQIFGIAITELTSLLTRRGVYCSKKANGKYSVCDEFTDEQGNIIFNPLKHTWKNGTCIYCGASQSVYERENELESYAYNFIHTDNPEELFNMKFDVIIGNPPYHLSDGGDNEEKNRTRGGAIPLYNKFVHQAKVLNPRFLIMIIPSRWFSGGRGLDDFRSEMLNDRRIRKLIDYPISSELFPGVEIKGGVCYFLWDRDNEGDCEVITIHNNQESKLIRPLLEKDSDIFIRYNESINILRKVISKKEQPFSKLVSAQKPFGLRTYVKGQNKPTNNSVKLYSNKSIGYINREAITQNRAWVDKHKVYITMAYGAGEGFPHQILNKPLYGAPNSCCTETYLLIGPFSSRKISYNVISYIQTRFFRFLVLLRKNTQHAAKNVYTFVPSQDFNNPLSDEILYKKYNLTKAEIDFIESMVRPMELDNE